MAPDAFLFPGLSILLVDDDDSVRFSLSVALKNVCALYEADTSDHCLDIMRKRDIDVMLLAVGLKSRTGAPVSGIDLIPAIKNIKPNVQIIMITANDDFANALKAIQAGAFDYINKPYDVDELRLLVRRVLEKCRLQVQNEYLQHELIVNATVQNVVVRNAALIELYHRAKQVATTPSSVLITGENGTGKEILARYIHSQSERAQAPFVAINCGAIPENLLESELFGYEKGAFTGAVATKRGRLELAEGGTVFLDEIGHMDLSMQVKLLRVLQDRQLERLGGDTPIPLDVRIISATNVDLKHAIASGSFREDLYFRLNVVSFPLPALRNRPEDIDALLDHYIDFFATQFKGEPLMIAPIVRSYLLKFDWPGNIRQLRNLIESFYALYAGRREISFSCLPVEMLVRPIPQGEVEPDRVEILPLKTACEEFEKDYIRRVISQCDYNHSRAARLLNIHRNTLTQKIALYGLND